MRTNTLLKQLQKNQLLNLDLSGRTLTFARAKLIFSGISQSGCKLKTLNLNNCSIAKAEREDVLLLLAQGLQQNTSLNEVNISLAFSFTDAANHALIQACRLNHTITKFTVNTNYFNEQTSRSINLDLHENCMLNERNRDDTQGSSYNIKFFKSTPTTTPTNSRQGSTEDMFISQNNTPTALALKVK